MNLRLLLLSVTHSRVAAGLLLLNVVLFSGTLAFMVVEGWSFGDAFFMALTTVTTVGYGEVRPLDGEGRVIAVVLILLGVGTAFYILTAMVAAIIEGDLSQLFGLRRIRTMIERLDDHYIICGHGRVGDEIARELADRGVAFVVIEADEAALARARAANRLTIAGDATSEETLLAAGIARARVVIAASSSDVVNTYITLTARSLRPDVFIVARVSTPELESKLRQAGASRVVSPYAIGGRRMALAALQPLMTDFIDLVGAKPGSERILAEFAIDDASGLAGQSVAEAMSVCRDAVVLAVRNPAGEITVGPAPSARLSLGDRLTVVGDEAELRAIGAVAHGPVR